MKIIDFNTAEGGARQGDVYIWPLPSGSEVSRTQPIAARDGRIILAEGEATGHHHSILAHVFAPPAFRDDGMARAAETGFRPTVGVATLYRDDALTQRLLSTHLTTADLCVGYLVVEHGPVIVEHQEHDAIRVPPGAYYVGRQRESIAGELRRVQD